MVSAFNDTLNIWSVTGIPAWPLQHSVNTPATVTTFIDPPSALQIMEAAQ